MAVSLQVCWLAVHYRVIICRSVSVLSRGFHFPFWTNTSNVWLLQLRRMRSQSPSIPPTTYPALFSFLLHFLLSSPAPSPAFTFHLSDILNFLPVQDETQQHSSWPIFVDTTSNCLTVFIIKYQSMPPPRASLTCSQSRPGSTVLGIRQQFSRSIILCQTDRDKAEEWEVSSDWLIGDPLISQYWASCGPSQGISTYCHRAQPLALTVFFLCLGSIISRSTSLLSTIWWFC